MLCTALGTEGAKLSKFGPQGTYHLDGEIGKQQTSLQFMSAITEDG